MRVIGTAGHVDHGKSTLVKALTGTHPDRLKEEREREMTIDLGFAFLNLPGGEEIGIVDVPGHRDFIENMLSGVGGIDAALFVVAADEGVMPQTREHLAILDLLQIDGGVVALTKIDLVEDPDWLELVEEEVRTVLKGTVLENAPVIRAAARSGEGVVEVAAAIENLFRTRPFRSDYGQPRLPIDRVFSVAGFGTVVTGTLLDGSLMTGREVEIAPFGAKGRVRGLQSHNRTESFVSPGNRVAVNISGVSVEEVPRGNWVVEPNSYPITRRLDLAFNMLPDASSPLKHDGEIKFFIGAAEVMGRARVLGVDTIRPGTSGWLQVELVDPVVARRGDRYIIRRPSPGETIGGGEVVDPEPVGRHKRFSASVLDRLEALADGTPEDVFVQAAKSLGLAPLKQVARASSLDPVMIEELLPDLFGGHPGVLVNVGTGDLKSQSETLIAHKDTWEALNNRVQHEVSGYLMKQPLKFGMPKEELRSKLKLSSTAFNDVIELMAANRSIDLDQAYVIMPGHEIRFSDAQQIGVDKILKQFGLKPYSPPTVKECISVLGEDVFGAMLDLKMLIQVSADVVFRKQDYDHLVNEIRKMIEAKGMITIGEFRDRFSTSRKYALGILEHLDSIGITFRDGDGRKLRR